MNRSDELKGQVAVVTGSAVGIGRGVALGLAARGANVVGLDIDIANNGETARQVSALGAEFLDIHCDLGDAAAIARAFAAVDSRFGRVDVLVNNAAQWLDCSLTGGTFESQSANFLRSMNACAMGSFYCALAATPLLKKQGGNIVNIITEHIKEGHFITGRPATGYDCAKFSQWRLTESWAVELAPFGIRVNALCFGATDTPMLRAAAPQIADKAMQPADLAQAVFNVMSHGAAGPTGQTYLFGTSGSPREASLLQIAALAP
jgi:3-oxoacyl-[acyl-carrier protein] reductase